MDPSKILQDAIEIQQNCTGPLKKRKIDVQIRWWHEQKVQIMAATLKFIQICMRQKIVVAFLYRM